MTWGELINAETRLLRTYKIPGVRPMVIPMQSKCFYCDSQAKHFFFFTVIKKHIMKVAVPRTTYTESALMLSFILLYEGITLE